jgi:phytoene synthase
MNELGRSYRLCGQIARRSAKSFYYSFLLLPRPQRRAMCALYAFLRRTDDIADGDQPLKLRRAALERWRGSLAAALEGRFEDPILPALADTVARYQIRRADLVAVIDGVQMDLDQYHYETFADLAAYCDRVAGAVGLACLRIWNCHAAEAEPAARHCGIAFQLTNILRDLQEDLDHRRVYLPQEDLRRFEVDMSVLRGGIRDARFRALMQFEIQRAESFYDQGAILERYLTADARMAFCAMMSTYRALLGEIKRRGGDVFSRRVRLTSWHKWRIVARSLVHHSPLVARWREAIRE